MVVVRGGLNIYPTSFPFTFALWYFTFTPIVFLRPDQNILISIYFYLEVSLKKWIVAPQIFLYINVRQLNK